MANQTNLTELPAAFVRQPATVELKFKPDRNVPVHRLPFVDYQPGRPSVCFWAVPKTGGYFGGNETGTALAKIYLKYLKANPGKHGNLPSIVLDMFDCRHDVSPEQDTLRAQAVGFFAELEALITAAVKHLDGKLDRLDADELLNKANAGLNLDDEAFMASLSENENEE